MDLCDHPVARTSSSSTSHDLQSSRLFVCLRVMRVDNHHHGLTSIPTSLLGSRGSNRIRSGSGVRAVFANLPRGTRRRTRPGRGRGGQLRLLLCLARSVLSEAQVPGCGFKPMRRRRIGEARLGLRAALPIRAPRCGPVRVGAQPGFAP